MRLTRKLFKFAVIISVIGFLALSSAGCFIDDDEDIAKKIEMVSIPAGTFIMGSPDCEPGRRDDNESQHPVTLSGFSMSRYEVTQAQYRAVMGDDEDRTYKGNGQGDNYPIYNVSWYDALVFCNKLSMKEGLNPVYSIGGKTDPEVWGVIPSDSNAAWNAAKMDRGKNGYRLPTEAEWEYACRGSYAEKTTEENTKTFSLGDGTKMLGSMANFNGWYPYDLARLGEYYDTDGTCLGQTIKVGSYTANNYGLYDMHGNLYEWCWDWYGNYSFDVQTDPTGTVSGTYRVGRGGGWNNNGQYLRSACRGASYPNNRGNNGGFRLVRSN